jgi:hypothetical protein
LSRRWTENGEHFSGNGERFSENGERFAADRHPLAGDGACYAGVRARETILKNTFHLSQGSLESLCAEPTEKVQYVNLINDCTLGRDIGESQFVTYY